MSDTFIVPTTYPEVFAIHWGKTFTVCPQDFAILPQESRIERRYGTVAARIATAVVQASFMKGNWETISPNLMKNIRQHLVSDARGVSADSYTVALALLKEKGLIVETQVGDENHLKPSAALAALAVRHLTQEVVGMVAKG